MTYDDYKLAQKLQMEYDNLKNEKENKDKYRSPIRSNTKPLANSNVITRGNLADPTWEFVDPTPDVYALFMAFDVRFFWGKLKSVVVRWSKRMYKCAGICSYQGRGGLCTVSLSEPLLKLRPRKDLVETLLHEMIHAYLFLTNNNRDRDGHGPEFHKHMYRINKEAGVNISVYHSFHDEVKVYQTHWWRCTGVCRSRAPFFGMIKRTCNRAPGPNDFWWKQHSMTCNGTFEKIKEPEKKITKSAGKGKAINGTTRKRKNPTASNQSTITTFTKNTKVSSITRPDISTNSIIIKRPTVTGNLVNVKGFKDLDSETNVPDTARPNIFGGTGYSLGDNKVLDKTNMTSNALSDVRNHWANKFPISAKKRVSDTDDFDNNKRQKIIDNKELNKSTSNSQGNSNSEFVESVCLSDNEEDTKVTLENKSIDSDEEIFHPVELLINCPVCKKITPEISINEHLDKCKKNEMILEVENENVDSINTIINPGEVSVACPVCNKNTPENKINEHLDECMSLSFIAEEEDVQIIEPKYDVVVIDDDDSLVTEFNGDDSLIEDYMNNSTNSKKLIIDSDKSATLDDVIKCPLCNVEMKRTDLGYHLDTCISDDFTPNNIKQEISLEDQTNALKAAGYTKKEIDECVQSINLENIAGPSKSSVTKDLKTSIRDLDNTYFNESINASFVGSQSIEIDDDDESYLGDMTQNDIPNSFPCPKCLVLITLEDMNFHLDSCISV